MESAQDIKKNSPLTELEFLRRMPKVELHLHLEGTLEPDLLWELAARNQIALPYSSVQEIQQAYDNVKDMQSFLELYEQGMAVLIKEQDFYDLAWTYLLRMKDETTRHVEVFFDPQPHLKRGISFETVVNGFFQALQTAHTKLDVSFRLIMCFVRHLPVESALATLELSLPHKDKIDAVGLDSEEQGHHPSQYTALFEACRQAGYRCVAHAGEEGPPAYVWSALDDLKVERIDHGVRSMEDPALVDRLIREQTPLTVCPLSEVKLGGFPCMAQHCVRKMLHAGLCVTINSDDPAYFGGYLTENFCAIARELGVTRPEAVQLSKNAVKASFLDDAGKNKLMAEVEEFASKYLGKGDE